MSARISLTAIEIDELLLALKSWRETCRKGDFDFRLEGVEKKLDRLKRKQEKTNA